MDWVFSLIPDISLATANKFYTLGWAASLVGAAITFTGVIFLMWGTRVRDHDFEDSIAKLHERAASSEERTAELQGGNLRLQADVERERIERLKLEEKLGPRRIAPDMRARIVAALKVAPKGIVFLRPTQTDNEPIQLAEQLESIFREGGFDVRRWEHSVIHLGMVGLLIALRNISAPPPHGVWVQKAFEDNGMRLDARDRDIPDVPEGTIIIDIGVKP